MFFKQIIQTSSIKSNYVQSTVYLIQAPQTIQVQNAVRKLFFQALFNYIILKYTNSSTFKALKIVQ